MFNTHRKFYCNSYIESSGRSFNAGSEASSIVNIWSTSPVRMKEKIVILYYNNAFVNIFDLLKHYLFCSVINSNCVAGKMFQ